MVRNPVDDNALLEHLRRNAGERFSIPELAESFGVGQAAMRYSIERLHKNGKVKREGGGSGSRVDWYIPSEAEMPKPVLCPAFPMREYQGDPVIRERVDASTAQREAYPSKHI